MRHETLGDNLTDSNLFPHCRDRMRRTGLGPPRGSNSLITSYSKVVNISDGTLAWPGALNLWASYGRVLQLKLLKVNMGTAECSQQTILIAAEG